MGWIRKGVSDKVKKTIRLRKIWDDMIKEYARRTGLTQIAVIEKLLAYGDKRFRQEHGLGEESDEAEDRDKAVKEAKKQSLIVNPNDTRTVEQRYMERIMNQGLKRTEQGLMPAEQDLNRLVPRNVWDKLLGRRREDVWRPV